MRSLGAVLAVNGDQVYGEQHHDHDEYCPKLT